LAWFFGDTLTAEIVDKAQLVGEEEVMEALQARGGEVGGDGAVGWCCIEAVDLRVKGPFVPVR
jgi:hypothetical protein